MIAVILAAGLSTRFDGIKLLHCIDDIPMIGHVVNSLSPLLPTYVVVGGHSEKMIPYLNSLDCQIIENLEFREGMHRSVQKAIELGLSREEDILLTLGDLPYVSKTHFEDLISHYRGNVLFSKWKEVVSPPCLIPYEDLLLLKNVEVNKGLKSYFTDYDVFELKEASLDIDTRKDLI